MRQPNTFAPGWLRKEIGLALQQVTRISGISEGMRSSFEAIAEAIEGSKSLRRADEKPRRLETHSSVSAPEAD
jgi:hypothetical protein